MPWIRFGSVRDPWHFGTNPDSDPNPRIKNIFVMLIPFLRNFYIILQRRKSHREVKKSTNLVFSTFFCLLMEGSGSGSVQINYGSGSALFLCILNLTVSPGIPLRILICVSGFGLKSSPVSPPQYCPGGGPVRGLPRYRQRGGVPQPPPDCRVVAPPAPTARTHPSGHLPHLQAGAGRSGTKPARPLS